MNTFEKLHPVLQEILLTGLKWDSLRPVQEETYAAVTAGNDVLVLAPTAGGKTESAFLPVIDALLKKPASESIRAVYLSPLKALINDQMTRILRLCDRAGLQTAVQHGDIAARDRWKFKTGEVPDILLTTPESLEVLLADSHSSPAFQGVCFIIIDEIHAFMETDRGVHLKCLIDRLTLKSTTNPLRIGLSATVGNPGELLKWMSGNGRSQRLVQIPAPETKKQFSFVVEPDFQKQIQAIIRCVRGKNVLLFTESRTFAERLIEPLRAELDSVFVHHSSVSANEREKAELSFQQGGSSCVICTSTMELGIDIGELDMVVQYGPPRSVASFLQRLGRTGRRGKPAAMTFIVQNAGELLITVSVIESAMRHESECLIAPTCSYHVFVQQLFLLMKGKRGLGQSSVIRSMRALSPFAAVPDAVISEILAHLVENRYLVREGDLYGIGERAETELGKSNWITLLSVIHDSGGYLAVLPDGTPIGTLDPRFTGGEPGKVFSFTGKTWRFLHRDDVHRRILVESASAKKDMKRPFWSGGEGAGTSVLVCKSVQSLLARGTTLLPLPENERAVLDGVIQSLPDDFVPGKLHLRIEPEENGYSVVISTFAGKRTNEVLCRLLKNRLAGMHAMQVSDFAVRVFDFTSRKGLNAVDEVLHSLVSCSWQELIAELPEVPRSTWKFGELLPDSLILEMAAKEYYHLPEFIELVK